MVLLVGLVGGDFNGVVGVWEVLWLVMYCYSTLAGRPNPPLKEGRGLIALQVGKVLLPGFLPLPLLRGKRGGGFGGGSYFAPGR